MVYRICLALTCVFALAGCYTQIRPPEYETEGPVGYASPADIDTVVVYRQYVYNSFDSYGWGVARYYEPYFPGYPSWARRGFRWRHAYWTSAYGPWWRGWMRRVLARGTIARSHVQISSGRRRSDRPSRATPAHQIHRIAGWGARARRYRPEGQDKKDDAEATSACGKRHPNRFED